MDIIAEGVRAVLVPFLALCAAVLVVLLCHVVLLHATRETALRRRQRLLEAYRPLVSAVLNGGADDLLQRLKASPSRHRPILAALILEPLRIAEGAVTERARAMANALDLVARWEADLAGRRSWERAEAAYALGVLKCANSVRPLIRALDDTDEEVRAAAVDALGSIGEPSALPELVARLDQQSRHQRVRLVQAIRQFGSLAVAPLLEHARTHPADIASIADLFGNIEAAEAAPHLLEWCADGRTEVRAAVIRALGAIGPDERTYYHILRALNDDAGEVRAAAAWALGRSGRHEAAAYLEARLEDDWDVAAQSARALQRLGAPGRQALEAAATGARGELARQALWEAGARVRA
jgi:HEAT repeat protein